MKLSNPIILLISILILSVLFLPAFTGTGVINVPDEDDLADDDEFSFISNFSVAWIIVPVHERKAVLRLGLSMFTLFVVYLGGRSKHRRFNDRTLDHVDLLTTESLKTALIRAVFNFPFFVRRFGNPNKRFAYRFLPTHIPNFRKSQKLRRYPRTRAHALVLGLLPVISRFTESKEVLT